ncbi:MAG: cell division protein FtsZ [Rhizobiales bacterium]|nr:cell division protein FtsZ [Hyphomicrobiales bacterium]
MTINLKMPDIRELKPKITVFGVGGAGGNAVNNMIKSGLEGVEFVVANTDAQALSSSRAERIVQMGLQVTEGLGAGSQPEIGRQAAEEVIDEINDYLSGSHMAFITAGMGGGTGTGAAPVVARAARQMGILTVGVVTKPFQFEGGRRMRLAEQGIEELQANVDTLIVIPNQNLFRVANEKTTFADAFSMADQVLYSGVACITDLMVKEGLINLDFADVRSVMREMGKAMMGTGEASGENRATLAAEAAIANPLLDETSMHGAQGLLISITGGNDLTLFEVDEAATRIREEVDPDANIILGATFDESLEGIIRVSVVATGIEHGTQRAALPEIKPASSFMRPSAAIPVAKADVPAASVQAPFQATASAPLPVAASEPVMQPAPQPAVAKSDPAVTITPFTPSAEALQLAQNAGEMSAVEEFEQTAPAPADVPAAPSGPFIPPVAEAPFVAPRMPSVDDFPMIVQEEIRAKATSSLDMGHTEERGALGLLKRITNATLGGRRDDDAAHHEGVHPAAMHVPATAPMATMAQPVQQPVYHQPQPSAAYPAPQPAPHPAPHPTVQSAFAKPAMPRAASIPGDAAPVYAGSGHAGGYAPAAGQLDLQGRVVPSQKPAAAEDQLEIPAFLRRQAT